MTILSSVVSGSLNLKDGQTTLDGVTGGNIVATNKVVVQHSSLSSLQLASGATASIDHVLVLPEPHACTASADNLIARGEPSPTREA